MVRETQKSCVSRWTGGISPSSGAGQEKCDPRRISLGLPLEAKAEKQRILEEERDKVNAIDEIGQHELTIRAKAISNKTSLLNKCHEKREALMNIEADRFICKKRNEEKRHIGEANRIEHEHKITENAIQTEHDP